MSTAAAAPRAPVFTYRPALDGIRAVAVAGVLLFHGGVAALPGGFLGVDAFFVLSGFLITSLLLAEYQRDGRIRLGAFWLRRARRLLPALLLVLIATVLAYRSVLDAVELRLLRGDALAALGYMANWRMIYRGDDYFTQTSAPSPLQHTWSLGIEEQFYLIWPLLLVALLVLGLRRRPVLLSALCLLAAAGSALAAALTYRPLDVNRSYFGTDTRAEALLLGCALAALLTVRFGARAARWVTIISAALGVAGLVLLGWLWASVDGADALLYRGGLTAAGLAVAAVIAHVMRSPGGPVARLLALAPVVWLGRVSYGVYLWHWPLFGLVNADRTGLHGPSLLGVRVALTLAVAAVSYWLVEQPIRTGRWPWPLPAGWLRRPAGGTRARRRPSPAWAGAVIAFVGSGVLVVVATTPPTRPAQSIALPAAPSPTETTAPPPIKRPDRKPGGKPRITFFGDSVSWSLGTYLPEQRQLDVTVRAIQGCGIARLPDLMQVGKGGTNYPGCTEWDRRWRRGVDKDDPDVAVILLDRWELMDRRLGSDYHHVGEPVYDAYLSSELDLAISIVSARGAHVALLTAPYTHRSERYDGSLYNEDLPDRVDAWNRLLYRAAAKNPKRISIIELNARVCPGGKFTWTVGNNVRIRSDGLHFTESGVQEWIAPWLLPKLAALAIGAPMPGGSY